jgi:hypothetical protein
LKQLENVYLRQCLKDEIKMPCIKTFKFTFLEKVFAKVLALGKSILLYYTIQILFDSVIAKIMLDTPFLLLLMYKKCTQKKFDLPCSEKILIQIYGKYGYMRDFFFSAQLLIILLHIHTLLPNVHMYMH